MIVKASGVGVPARWVSKGVKMDRKISDLTVDELTEIIAEIIDKRISALLDSDGELREDFIAELLKRKEDPDLVDIDEVWSD